ncbi:MAG: hydroxyethylthiazole kinase [Chlorobiaceae bacterium]|nr:hydroxyethylthiazole kinase [Chlorobiaceae bacterium]
MSVPVPGMESLEWPHPDLQDDLARLRGRSPLVHCITNAVVTNFTANVLLAVGAAPAMVVSVEEAAEFVRIADALLLNVGTITVPDAEAMLMAAETAVATGTPWVLDPVAAGVLTYRTSVVGKLVGLRPTVIRGNASEILALNGLNGAGRGVDSTVASTDALPAAIELARGTGSVVALSGKVDYVTDGEQVVSVEGGHELMSRVTGMGCTLGALIAAFLPVSATPFRAAAAASAIFGAVGGDAAGRAGGPGSFAVGFLDRLSTIGLQDAFQGA